MKRIISIVTIISLLLICSCGKTTSSDESKENSMVSEGVLSTENSSTDTATSTDNGSTDTTTSTDNGSVDTTTSTDNGSVDTNQSTDNGSGDVSTDIADTDFKTVDLMTGLTSEQIDVLDDMTDGNTAYMNFALELFKKSYENDSSNTLISPLSAIYALGLVANGADSETLIQMENAFGISVNDLNNYLYSYAMKLRRNDSLSIANSIWFANDNRIVVDPDFLQKNADYYNAAAYKADFKNPETVNEINKWVSDNTKGMIPTIINQIPENAVMYLINALAFEDEWYKQYNKFNVRNGEFTLENGDKKDVEFMYSEEGTFLQDDNATGFIKHYKGKYAFVALLPNEGISVNDYISRLTGEKIQSILKNKSYKTVYASLPKFETKFEFSLVDILQSMGITDAFNPNIADFSKIGDAYHLHISDAFQKTYISVGELGTKAGAVTVIEMAPESAPDPMEIEYVYLNRPFVYMLIDTETNTPFFIGAYTD